MSNAINPLGAGLGIAPLRLPNGGASPSDKPGGFDQVLTDAVQKVEQFRVDANQSVDRFLAGEGEEVHRVAMKTQQAELAFEMFLQVRNKVVQAYQEVMRMQV